MLTLQIALIKPNQLGNMLRTICYAWRGILGPFDFTPQNQPVKDQSFLKTQTQHIRSFRAEDLLQNAVLRFQSNPAILNMSYKHKYLGTMGPWNCETLFGPIFVHTFSALQCSFIESCSTYFLFKYYLKIFPPLSVKLSMN